MRAIRSSIQGAVAYARVGSDQSAERAEIQIEILGCEIELGCERLDGLFFMSVSQMASTWAGSSV